MKRDYAFRFSLIGLVICLHLSAAATAVAQEQAAPPAPAAAPAVAPAAPSDPAKLAAALELMDAIGASNNFDNMLKMLKTHVTAGAGDGPAAQASTDAFDKLITQFGTYKKQMTDETAALYASKFSVAELKSVTDFYRSGAGARFIAEMPALMEQAANIGQKYAVQMMKDLKAAKDASSNPQ